MAKSFCSYKLSSSKAARWLFGAIVRDLSYVENMFYSKVRGFNYVIKINTVFQLCQSYVKNIVRAKHAL